MADRDFRALAEQYNELRLKFETLSHQVARLVDTYGGSERMPSAERERYRQLARERDDLANELLILQNQLFADDESES